MKEICVLGFLGWNAWTDLKKRRISLIPTVIAIISGIIFSICKQESAWSLMGAAFIGAFFCFLSVASNGALGMGDGLIILALGMWIGGMELLISVLSALLGSGLWSAVLLVIFHRGRKSEIPFVPFLLAGYAGGVLLWKIL